jgi:hypothetical protein
MQICKACSFANATRWWIDREGDLIVNLTINFGSLFELRIDDRQLI